TRGCSSAAAKTAKAARSLHAHSSAGSTGSAVSVSEPNTQRASSARGDGSDVSAPSPAYASEPTARPSAARSNTTTAAGAVLVRSHGPRPAIWASSGPSTDCCAEATAAATSSTHSPTDQSEGSVNERPSSRAASAPATSSSGGTVVRNATGSGPPT